MFESDARLCGCWCLLPDHVVEPANAAYLLDRYFGEGRFALLSVADQIDIRTAGGRLVLNVLTSVAQWEREAIGERTKAALEHLRDAQGVQLGRDALGLDSH